MQHHEWEAIQFLCSALRVWSNMDQIGSECVVGRFWAELRSRVCVQSFIFVPLRDRCLRSGLHLCLENRRCSCDIKSRLRLKTRRRPSSDYFYSEGGRIRAIRISSTIWQKRWVRRQDEDGERPKIRRRTKRRDVNTQWDSTGGRTQDGDEGNSRFDWEDNSRVTGYQRDSKGQSSRDNDLAHHFRGQTHCATRWVEVRRNWYRHEWGWNCDTCVIRRICVWSVGYWKQNSERNWWDTLSCKTDENSRNIDRRCYEDKMDGQRLSYHSWDNWCHSKWWIDEYKQRHHIHEFDDDDERGWRVEFGKL